MPGNSVYFAHGKESGPWGTKISALAVIARRKGWAVESPDYSFTGNADERVRHLLSLKPAAEKHLLLVGSSMGGYVSTVASATLKPSGLFLLAPAFFIAGYEQQNPRPCAQQAAIVHGWHDEVVPVDNSIRFAREHGVALHVLDGDHRLTGVLPQIERLFSDFLDEVLISQ